MELIEAIKERRSCRNFKGTAVEDNKLQIILEAGGWAPSVMNVQPWRFYVIKNPSMKTRLKQSCEATAQEIFERSGWKWVSKYSFEFLVQAPVLIAVVASPKDTGADQFLPGRGQGYAFSCCAAIQNMLLAAHSVGVSTLWFSLYDTVKIKEIMEIPAGLDVVSIIVTGYAVEPAKAIPRKNITELTVVKE